MTPRCRQVLEDLVEAITGTLPPQERTGIAEHLAVCAGCRREAAAIETTVARLRGAGAFVVPPGFWAEFTDRLQARIALKRQPWPLHVRRWMASPRHARGTLAAAAALAFAVFAAVRLTPPRPPALDPVTLRARGLVTETMSATLPSLGEVLDTWRAGLVLETDDVTDRRPP
ncbi:MAG: zf-HC2 domain-containing protein [Armatimonadota bacterium]|nr:zf-HC2 domain-containing protein [Armatimonadota bacterium]MDR7549535.1 zf-HC2 domain-containing protein [Armatimonadota bacterium]